jgi:flagellar M-ring protein FliF
MNFLNNAIAQVSELFRSMTPGARITAGLLLAVVVASFGFLFRHGAAGPDDYLFGGKVLSDGELNRIELAIGEAGLTGHAREGNRIRVPAGQQAAYLAAIAEAGAQPANFNPILEDAIGATSPWESREAARERIKDAKQRQLSEIVRAMPWVEEAVVILDEQENRGLSKQRVVTASVSVQPKAGELMDPRRALTLRKFLASSVIGLNPDSVAVTDLSGGGAFAGGGAIDPAMFDNPYYREKLLYEHSKRDSILRILSPTIPGVLVEVNAELDDTATETTITSTPDNASRVTVRSTESEESSKQAGGGAGGRPGVTASSANGPSQPSIAQTQPNVNETLKRVVEEQSDFGKEQRQITRQGLTPKEVQASVAIPRNYLEKIWQDLNPTATTPPPPEELKAIESDVVTKVENIVEPLIRKTADQGQNTYKRVKVVFLSTLPPPQITPPSVSTKAIAWTTRYWNTLAMLGVAMFSLMVLRSVVKGASAAVSLGATAGPTLSINPDETAQLGGAPHSTADNTPAAPPADDRPRLRLKKGTSVKDDLVDIVREDPDAAADILRSWIGKAG